MFGCGVPVCSANYSCVEELIHNDWNGMLFNDAEELASQLKVRIYLTRKKRLRRNQVKRESIAFSSRLYFFVFFLSSSSKN